MLTVAAGVPVETGWPRELRTVKDGTVTEVLPRAMAWKFRVTSTPAPFTPGVPGCRFNWIEAIPVSLAMFLVKTGCWPSLERKSPRRMSVRRSTFGSYCMVMGADATSVPLSSIRESENWPPILVSTCGGENCTRALLGGAAGSATGGGAPGISGGAVAGGIRPGGAVAGGIPGTVVGTPGVVVEGA